MWLIPLTRKFSLNLLITVIGVGLLSLTLLHLGRVAWLLSRQPQTLPPSSTPAETTIIDALNLVNNQTNSD
ncbi:hypothetical protein A2W24_03365 [Microgenomates group bacterium RBG_16_45_19]|nr:MAG: hypothetical protein A2W24_03365 [Microgenomates group bacterium RBG_16_45_19]